MRRRLSLVVLFPLMAVGGAHSSAAAQEQPPTHGVLIPGGAEATAGYHEYDEGSGAPAVGPSGTNTPRECWLEHSVGGLWEAATLAELQQHLADQQAAGGADTIQVRRICVNAGTRDGNTGVDRSTPVNREWPTDGAGVYVPPAELMIQARELLWPPPPRGFSAPALADGAVAQLPVYFTIGNWGPVSVRATAGSAWAEVTATPVAQTWTIRDGRRDEVYTVTCPTGGVPFDPTTGGTPPPDACVWDQPPHSSAGQTARSEIAGEAQGQPCFQATVTITWDVSWTSSANGSPIALEPGLESAASTCIVVKEVQAVVTGDPGD